MKRKAMVIVAVLVTVALLTVYFMLPTGALEIKRYYGDVDNDGYVTTVDARIVLMCVAGIYEKTLLGLDYEAADMDDDGKLTTIDARLTLQTAAGQLDERFMVGYEFTENHQEFTKLINDYSYEKDHKLIKLTLSNDLCDAARVAAQEYALKTGSAFIREDGSYFYKLLDEKGIVYNVADKVVIHSGYGYEKAFEDMLNDLQSEKLLTSKNFSKIGIGAYSTDNRTFYWCIFVTK